MPPVREPRREVAHTSNEFDDGSELGEAKGRRPRVPAEAVSYQRHTKWPNPHQLHNPANWIAELCRIWVPFLQTGSWYYMKVEDPGRGTILKLNSSSF